MRISEDQTPLKVNVSSVPWVLNLLFEKIYEFDCWGLVISGAFCGLRGLFDAMVRQNGS
jgi:hypothetical protein